MKEGSILLFNVQQRGEDSMILRRRPISYHLSLLYTLHGGQFCIILVERLDRLEAKS